VREERRKVKKIKLERPVSLKHWAVEFIKGIFNKSE
jgi:hypothetical protein